MTSHMGIQQADGIRLPYKPLGGNGLQALYVRVYAGAGSILLRVRVRVA